MWSVSVVVGPSFIVHILLKLLCLGGVVWSVSVVVFPSSFIVHILLKLLCLWGCCVVNECSYKFIENHFFTTLL